ncbi:GNAT family N-acetyltransferase [Flexivirga alba]|uniref:GNAT family N-acetyltransferase n=1 Tax=Flexivirga alba TaxID=702742 RepID=A0ABW2AJI9_9MICO
MPIELNTPDVDALFDVTEALRDWQRDDLPLQLHPGDLGWFWRFGAEATAAATRAWTRDGRIVAVGMADEPDLIRMTLAPDLAHDVELAERLATDLSDPTRGILGEGEVVVEVPNDVRVRDVLREKGWQLDEEWTPMRHDLADLPEPELRIEVVGPDLADARTALQRASFENSKFTADGWHAMAGGVPYADARCLLGYDDEGAAVAAVTVWSAGPGKPGLIEPMGVHRDHRRKGHGRAICHAAGIALRDMGSSSMLVCTPSSNVGGVAAYVSAGFEKLPLRRDLGRKE